MKQSLVLCKSNNFANFKLARLFEITAIVICVRSHAISGRDKNEKKEPSPVPTRCATDYISACHDLLAICPLPIKRPSASSNLTVCHY